jgi:putative Mg2+ transporter-C (MgtC) family protein
VWLCVLCVLRGEVWIHVDVGLANFSEQMRSEIQAQTAVAFRLKRCMDFLWNAFTPQAADQAVETIFKLIVGALFGGFIGVEREMHGRPAGVRTHMLVVIGVILFSEVSKHFGGGDPARIAAQIVTGIGFLGAGAILRLGAEIKGLTTAASIWASAGIGMAVSVGGAFLIIAMGGTVLALFTLAVVDNIERRIAPQFEERICEVEISRPDDLGNIINALNRASGKLQGLKVISTSPAFIVHLSVVGNSEKILSALGKCDGVRSVKWIAEI